MDSVSQGEPREGGDGSPSLHHLLLSQTVPAQTVRVGSLPPASTSDGGHTARRDRQRLPSPCDALAQHTEAPGSLTEKRPHGTERSSGNTVHAGAAIRPVWASFPQTPHRMKEAGVEPTGLVPGPLLWTE